MKKLTVKERKAIQFFFEVGSPTYGNKTLSAKKAGYRSKTKKGLNSLASQLFKKLQIPIKDLMIEAGLDDFHLLRKLNEGLDANVTKTASYQGRILDQKVYTDFQTRERYLDIAFKLRGSYAPVEVKGSVTADIGLRLAQAIEKAHGSKNAD